MLIFQNHMVFPGGLFLDLLLCISAISLFLILQKKCRLPQIGKNMNFWDIILVYFFVLFIPNSTYAFFEMKHVIFSSLASVLVFGSVAFVGLACTLLGNFLVVHHYAKNKKETLLYYLFLSLIGGFGAVVGLLNYHSVSGFVPLFLPLIGIELLQNTPLVLLALITSFLIFILGYFTHCLFFQPPH